MKKSVNLNNIWADLFVSVLKYSGVKEVCISPGSRSTPLVSAFHNDQAIQKHLIIDERSAAFFALGRAKITKDPVAIVTTSGTAVAELYPAIIEAYKSRIPLIICTADRPPDEHNCGANQTINQYNIFSNHTRFFYDTGLPLFDDEAIKELKENVTRGLSIAVRDNRGPVHFNLPFAKPLERSQINAEIDSVLIDEIIKDETTSPGINSYPDIPSECIRNLNKYENGIILCGSGSYSDEDKQSVLKLSKTLGYPVFAEALSGFRSSGISSEMVISNYPHFLQDPETSNTISPEIIIQFGSTPTLNPVMDFYKKSDSYKILINESGDLFDPSRTTDLIIKASPNYFCKSVLEKITKPDHPENNEWTGLFKNLDDKYESLKKDFLNHTDLSFEGKVVTEIIKNLPDQSILVAGNSMPVRDLENFMSLTDKQIEIFANRGASGIDGLISTAAGISCNSEKPVFLLIGDISFLHDIGSLSFLHRMNCRLNIILINNNGGHIFGMLPVKEEGEIFREYFTAPQNFNFSGLANTFNVEYFQISDPDAVCKVRESSKTKLIRIFEFKTDGDESVSLRKGLYNTFK